MFTVLDGTAMGKSSRRTSWCRPRAADGDVGPGRRDRAEVSGIVRGQNVPVGCSYFRVANKGQGDEYLLQTCFPIADTGHPNRRRAEARVQITLQAGGGAAGVGTTPHNYATLATRTPT